MANFFQKIMEFINGKAPQTKDYNFLNQGQQNVQNQLTNRLPGSNNAAFDWLNSILEDDEGALEDFQRPILENYNENIIPNLMEKFGGIGAKSSSAFNQTLAKQGRKLAGDLSTQRAGLKNNAVTALQNYSGQALNQSQGKYNQQGTSGLFGSNGGFGGLGNILSMFGIGG